QRRGGDRGAEDRAGRPGLRHPGVVAEVLDRAPPGRRRRRGGGGDDPRAARPDRRADAGVEGAGRRAGPRLRPRVRQAAEHRRQAGHRAVVVVRLRRPQRRSLFGGCVTLDLRTEPVDRLSPVERLQEGTAALAGYARIFREHVALSGRVPLISVVCGASAGGGSYSPALTDFVVMTQRATMFLTGPAVVREVMGEDVSAFSLGGHKVHERNGVAHFVAEDDPDAALLVRDLLDHLPSHSGERAPRWRPAGPPGYGVAAPVP